MTTTLAALPVPLSPVSDFGNPVFAPPAFLMPGALELPRSESEALSACASADSLALTWTGHCSHSSSAPVEGYCYGCHIDRQALQLQQPESCNMDTEPARPSSACSRKSVRFADTVTVNETYSKEDYPARSMLAAEDKDDQLPMPRNLGAMIVSFRSGAALPNLKNFW